MQCLRMALLLLFAKTVSAASFQESVSLNMKITGDLQGTYSFSGPVNSVLSAQSTEMSKCEATNLMRKTRVKAKDVFEVWVSLICTQEGQKKTYKLPRYFLDAGLPIRKFHVSPLDKNIRSLDVEFSGLSVQKGK